MKPEYLTELRDLRNQAREFNQRLWSERSRFSARISDCSDHFDLPGVPAPEGVDCAEALEEYGHLFTLTDDLDKMLRQMDWLIASLDKEAKNR